jgi:hypothetical protein
MEASFKGIVNGTLTVGKAFKNMMTTMLDAVVSSLVKIAAQWITSHALQMLLGKQEQASNSATAATGAASSAASIPIYGWIIAAAAAAAVFAAASSYSAASGFDIPSNLNPMTQLHSKEMVLPAPMAEKVRNMTDEGAKGGGSGAMNLHIQALDGHSVQRVLTRNATHVQQALKKINNRFMR